MAADNDQNNLTVTARQLNDAGYPATRVNLIAAIERRELNVLNTTGTRSKPNEKYLIRWGDALTWASSRKWRGRTSPDPVELHARIAAAIEQHPDASVYMIGKIAGCKDKTARRHMEAVCYGRDPAEYQRNGRPKKHKLEKIVTSKPPPPPIDDDIDDATTTARLRVADQLFLYLKSEHFPLWRAISRIDGPRRLELLNRMADCVIEHAETIFLRAINTAEQSERRDAVER